MENEERKSSDGRKMLIAKAMKIAKESEQSAYYHIEDNCIGDGECGFIREDGVERCVCGCEEEFTFDEVIEDVGEECFREMLESTGLYEDGFAMTLYEPVLYSDDGTNIEWSRPSELGENCVFETEQEAEEFMEDHCGYDSGEYKVSEVVMELGDDFAIVDSEGNAVIEFGDVEG